MFLGASPVKLFHFTPFGRKRLQTAPEAGGEALPNGALIYPNPKIPNGFFFLTEGAG